MNCEAVAEAEGKLGPLDLEGLLSICLKPFGSCTETNKRGEGGRNLKDERDP